MRSSLRRGLWVAVAALWVVAGAGPARCEKPWEQVAREAQQRTGASPERGAGDEAVASIVADALADGITREEAVSVALINNAELQAAFEELGIARADVIEAGLYANPELGVLLRFPEGQDGTEAEVELAFSVADLWLVPIRRGIARARAQETTMAVVQALLNTATDAKRAHDGSVVARLLCDQATEVLEAARAWRDQVRSRGEFGFSSDLDKSMADVFVAEREMELAEAEAEVAIAKAGLQRALDLNQQQMVEVVGELPEARGASPDTMALVERALAERPDLRAARLGLTASAKRLALERRSVWRHVTLGPAYAHDTDGTDLWGGALQVEIPLFDRNQAGRAQAVARARQTQSRVQALEALVREQVATSAANLRLALERERTIGEKILPARQQALDYSTRYYNEMQLNMLHVLQAREELCHAQKDHIAALGEIRAAEVELEFAVGGRLEDG